VALGAAARGKEKGGPGRGGTWRRRGGGATTPPWARQRRAPVGRHGSACGEETGEGVRGPVWGKKKGKWVGPNGIVKISIYSNIF
jgi:hypothetical protein